MSFTLISSEVKLPCQNCGKPVKDTATGNGTDVICPNCGAVAFQHFDKLNGVAITPANTKYGTIRIGSLIGGAIGDGAIVTPEKPEEGNGWDW